MQRAAAVFRAQPARFLAAAAAIAFLCLLGTFAAQVVATCVSEVRSCLPYHLVYCLVLPTSRTPEKAPAHECRYDPFNDARSGDFKALEGALLLQMPCMDSAMLQSRALTQGMLLLQARRLSAQRQAGAQREVLNPLLAPELAVPLIDVQSALREGYCAQYQVPHSSSAHVSSRAA
jgi:hypothetical protein